MVFEELDEYGKDLKKLSKRFRTLKDDLENVKKVLQVNPDANPPFSFQINDLGISNYIIKIKKIACKSLKGKGRNSGLRLVYAKSDIADEKIIFIELFFKGDKEMEDRDRILKYFK